MANYDLTYEGSEVQKILDTGDELQNAGYIFRGEATPSTVPGTPTERVAYIGGPGTYTNFGGSITVGAGCICVFKYTGSAWSNQVINTGLSDAISSAINSEATTRSEADTALQNAINAINNNIGNGYVYAGVATPSTSPVTGKVFYLAVQAGTYTNFGNAVVTAGLNVIKYNGSAWSVDQLIAIDAEPTQGSANLVKSGGVLNSIIQNGPAFDLSAYNAQGGVLATYADLSAALTAINALPADFKKGGMSMKYVQTSDNKYIQYILPKSSFSSNPADWICVTTNIEKVGTKVSYSDFTKTLGYTNLMNYVEVYSNTPLLQYTDITNCLVKTIVLRVPEECNINIYKVKRIRCKANNNNYAISSELISTFQVTKELIGNIFRIPLNVTLSKSETIMLSGSLYYSNTFVEEKGAFSVNGNIEENHWLRNSDATQSYSYYFEYIDIPTGDEIDLLESNNIVWYAGYNKDNWNKIEPYIVINTGVLDISNYQGKFLKLIMPLDHLSGAAISVDGWFTDVLENYAVYSDSTTHIIKVPHNAQQLKIQWGLAYAQSVPSLIYSKSFNIEYKNEKVKKLNLSIKDLRFGGWTSVGTFTDSGNYANLLSTPKIRIQDLDITITDTDNIGRYNCYYTVWHKDGTINTYTCPKVSDGHFMFYYGFNAINNSVADDNVEYVSINVRKLNTSFEKITASSINIIGQLDKQVIHVGADGKWDYTNLWDAFSDAIAYGNDGVTIIVHEGTYQMPERDVWMRWKSSTKNIAIIGTNKNACFLKGGGAYASTPPTYVDNAPLMVSGKVLIDNLTIISESENNRSYCIHADAFSRAGDVTTIRNCTLITNFDYAVGIGLSAQAKLEIITCDLTGGIFAHDQSNGGGANLLVKDCIIRGKVLLGTACNNPITATFVNNVVISNDPFEKDSDIALTSESFGNNIPAMNYSI